MLVDFFKYFKRPDFVNVLHRYFSKEMMRSIDMLQSGIFQRMVANTQTPIKTIIPISSHVFILLGT